MALRGVWQLQKLIVSYSDWGGSSRGISFEGIDRVGGHKEDDSRHNNKVAAFKPVGYGFKSYFGVKTAAFMELQLPAFKEKNPQLEVVSELIRDQHPHLKGFYKNKNQRVICVKNMYPEDILLHATRLRNALGRKVVKLKTRHVTKRPSVQGTWITAVKF